MIVTVETYQSRIGSHKSFIEAQNNLSQLKGKFWNHLVLLFYINVFYLPYLNSQLNKYKREHEVCTTWCVQMICYNNFYVPLLLRLSNDVEGKSRS